MNPHVILITDPEHAVPVQIERTGLRTIAVGTGDTASLALPYLPANADVKAGDVLSLKGGAKHTFKNTGTVTATIVETFGKAAK